MADGKPVHLGEIFNYRMDRRILACTIVIFLAAIFVYSIFFDILIPNMEAGDSYRDQVGALFIVPIFILALGQLLVGGIVFHLFAKAAKSADFLRALLQSSVLTLWFSLTYALFPKYGPFYYIVFVYGEAPWYALPIELAWTISAILIGTYLSRKLFGLPCRVGFFASVVVYTIMTLGAS